MGVCNHIWALTSTECRGEFQTSPGHEIVSEENPTIPLDPVFPPDNSGQGGLIPVVPPVINHPPGDVIPGGSGGSAPGGQRPPTGPGGFNPGGFPEDPDQLPGDQFGSEEELGKV